MRASMTRIASLKILALSHRFQVAWVYARRVPAEMINDEAIRDAPDKHLVHDPVRVLIPVGTAM